MSTALERLKAKANEVFTGKVEITRRGDQIVLPAGPPPMTNLEAIKWLQREEEAMHEEVTVVREIHAFPLDAAYATQRAIDKVCGAAFNGGITRHTATFDLQIGVKKDGSPDVVQVPWGSFEVAGMEKTTVETGFAMKNGTPIGTIIIHTIRLYQDKANELANEAVSQAKSGSVYRGKAVVLNYRDNLDRPIEDFRPDFCPTFFQGKDNPVVILNAETELELDKKLYDPIRLTKEWTQDGNSLKRGVLLYGAFGGGKSLTAAKVAWECQQNGWTFVYVSHADDIDKGLQFARSYQPAVVFAEDFKCDINEDRSEEFDVTKKLNVVDGVDNKEPAIMLVVTTNEEDRLHPGMLRPGRTDAAINIPAPSEETIFRLLQHFAPNGLDATLDELEPALKVLRGHTAAVIVECVQSAKLGILHETRQPVGKTRLGAHHINDAALGMRDHLDLLIRATKNQRGTKERRVKMASAEFVVPHGEMVEA